MMINTINSQTALLPGDITGQIKPQNLAQAAEQFEALFLRSLMQQMRKASDALTNEGDPFNSKQQRMMRDFYDDKLASQLASQRNSGIAEMIMTQLSPASGSKLKIVPPSAALHQQPNTLDLPVIPVMRQKEE